MFKLFFKHRPRVMTVEHKLAMQREMERQRRMKLHSDTALKANIADKLKNYDAGKDTTISHFTLADDGVGSRLLHSPADVKQQDVWGRADPREAGRWKKENRKRRN